MNQLNGRYVNVVLSIEDGRGMNFIENPVYISANFNGRILECAPVDPCDAPFFNTEFIWEIEKRDLRKIRNTNQPLRIECYSVRNQKYRDRIGFALISVRSAQIVSDEQAPPLTWLKFIGVHDRKSRQPEISISLTVRECAKKNAEKIETAPAAVTPAPTLEYSEPEISESEEEERPESARIFTKRSDNGGTVRIGHPADERFSLKLIVCDSANLDLLLPEVMVFGGTDRKFHICFQILGVAINSKPFEKNESMEMNEKIEVEILSNRSTLEDFLKTQEILITFCSDNEKLGITKVALGKLLFSDENDEIFEREETCFFKYPSKNGMVPCIAGMKPYIDIKTSLLLKNTSSNPSGDDVTVKSKDTFKRISTIPKESGDQSPRKKTRNKKKKEDVVDRKYKKYALEIGLKNLSIIAKKVDESKIAFKFQHPKSASFLSNANVKEETVCKFRLHYVCSEDKIAHVLKLYPPRISIVDSRDAKLTQEHNVNTALFSQKNAKNSIFQDDHLHLYTYQIMLKCPTDKQAFARCEIVMSLTETSLEGDCTSPLDLLPQIVDEEITINELIKLENWKKAEREAFKEKMSALEKFERDKLNEQLNISRRNAEAIIQQQIEKCQELQKELRDRANSIKTEKLLKNNRKSLSTTVLNNIKEKVGEKYAKYDNEMLLIVVNKLEIDNQALKDTIKQQNEQLRIHQKSALTKEQTTNLLQELRGLEEKFEEVQTAKGYFKNQWKKAYEEVHELRTKDYKQLQADLKQSREELSNLSLDSYTDISDRNNILYEGSRTSRMSAEFYREFK